MFHITFSGKFVWICACCYQFRHQGKCVSRYMISSRYDSTERRNLSLSFNAELSNVQHTYRCDISKHRPLKCPLDLSPVSLFLLHYVFPGRVWHNEASLQHWQLSWRCLNREIQWKQTASFSDRSQSSWLDNNRWGQRHLPHSGQCK